MTKLPQQKIIARALEIISDETKWTRGSIARLANSKPCGCRNPRAVCFCAVGALNRAAGEVLAVNAFHHAIEAERDVLAANHELRDLPTMNDLEGRETIIEMFKAALAISRSAPPPPAHKAEGCRHARQHSRTSGLPRMLDE
jgi:hypothetical protein